MQLSTLVNLFRTRSASPEMRLAIAKIGGADVPGLRTSLDSADSTVQSYT